MIAKKNLKQQTPVFPLFITILFSVIFLQRIAIPIGKNGIPISILIIYIHIFYLVLNKKVTINIIKMFLFIFTFVSIMASVLFSDYDYSVFSLLYLVILYLPFILSFKYHSNDTKRYLNVYQKMIFIISILSIVQFVSQELIGYSLNLTSFVPSKFIVQGYIFTYPIMGGSTILKSNGAGLLLEPSFLSQFVAISIIIEIIYFKRISRIFILIVTMITSFSGTGLIILIVFGLFALPKLGFKKILMFLPIFILLSIYFINSRYLQIFQLRFASLFIYSDKSSFYIRFIAPFLAIRDALNTSTKFLFGLGAGTADHLTLGYYANYSVIPKLLIEYGFFNMVLFMGFIIYCFFLSNKQSFIITGSIFLMYIALSGSLLQPPTVFLAYAFITILPEKNVLNKNIANHKI